MTCVPSCSLILDWAGNYRFLSEMRIGDLLYNPLDPSRPSMVVYLSAEPRVGVWDLFQYGGFRGVEGQRILVHNQWCGWARSRLVALSCVQR